MIIGCSGSGKSYFARELRDVTGIPLYYMDHLYWRENWTHVTNEELEKELDEIMARDKWIIDGDYFRTIERRMKKVDTIFFLDIDEKTCIESEAKRRGSKREDLPEYLVEEYDPEFVEWIKAFKAQRRPIIIKLLEKYKDREIHIFKTREEKEEYLSMLKKEIE